MTLTLPIVLLLRRRTPWITTSIKRLITLRNKAWRNFKRDGSATARASYKLLRNHVQTVLRNAKHEYFKQKLSNYKNSNELWKIVNGLGINDTSDDKELRLTPTHSTPTL